MEARSSFRVEFVSSVHEVYLDFIVCHDKSCTSDLINAVFYYELVAWMQKYLPRLMLTGWLTPS